MEAETNKRPEPCIICDGKYSVEAVAATCTSEPVCKEHIEQITKYLLEKKEREDKEGGKK